MGQIDIVNINHEYIDFLRMDSDLTGVLTTKYTESTNGGRKYIGIIFTIDEMDYFVPIHTGKKEENSKGNCVYFSTDGHRKIKRSKFDIYRIRTDINGDEHLETVIKCAYMIPVSKNDIIPYSIRLEPDLVKKINFNNLYKWLQVAYNQDSIIKRCKLLYTKKCEKINGKLPKTDTFYKYVDYFLPFPKAEQKCSEWTQKQTIEIIKNNQILLENSSGIQREWYIYLESQNLYKVIAQAKDYKRFFLAGLASKLDVKDYSSLSLYEATNLGIAFKKSVYHDYLKKLDLYDILRNSIAEFI